jgi:hypothetical protein
MPTSFHADRITLFCSASYAVTLLLELAHLFRPGGCAAAAAFAIAGLVAFRLPRHPEPAAGQPVRHPPVRRMGPRRVLLYGSLHHAASGPCSSSPSCSSSSGWRRRTPSPTPTPASGCPVLDVRGERFSIVHGVLLLLPRSAVASRL